MELLLQSGADPAIRSEGGQTPRHEAESNDLEASGRLEATQGEGARDGRTTTASHTGVSLGLTRVRIHPLRPEAITVAERAVLHRWRLVNEPEVTTGIQARHSSFTDIVVVPNGELIAVTTPEPRIEIRRQDDLRVVTEVARPTEGRHKLSAIDFSPDGR